MAEENSAVAIIPGECFRWRPRVRFIESFRNREAALGYAFEHGYNLIVEHNEGSSPLFDVMKDPDGVCTAGLKLELLKTEDVLVEPSPADWNTLMLSTLRQLAKRFAALVAILYARGIVPLSRRTAAVAKVCLREVAPLSKRAAAATRTYLRETVVPASRRAAAAARAYYFREVVPFSKRAVAATRTYLRETVIPSSRRAAVVAGTYLRKIAVTFRRAAAFASLYLREIAPILRNVAARCWSESKNASRRRSWAVVTVHNSNSSRLR